VVEFAAENGGYGKVVMLRHQGSTTTVYAHLGRFAPGIHRGAKVAQSDIIGYVGQTGLATGPHLHYGLTRNGVFVNPLREHMNQPPGEPVPSAAMAAFEAERDRALAQLEGTRHRPL
jgi:murein DD-endopeptidase MepM/ murein hydrolase activator NlpD